MRLLAIDGGGIRGIIPARVLAELERITGRQTHQLFDLIAGTSTGGIIGLGLTKPTSDGSAEYSAEQAVALYSEHGAEIFPGGGPPSLEQRIFGGRGLRGWTNPLRVMNDSGQRVGAPFGGNPAYGGNARYLPQGLEDLLTAHFGDTALSEALTDVMVVAYDMRHRRPHVFSSADAAHGGPNPLMREVARATSAGPTYFPPLELQIGADTGIFVDGGIAANNPSLLAYVAAVRADSPSEGVLVSLGTGAKTPSAPDSVTLATIASKDWLRVAVGLLSVSFDASSYFVDAMLADLLGSDKTRQRYWRIQSPLVHAESEMDNVSPHNIAALTLDADELIAQRATDLQRIAEVLTAA